MFVEPSDLVEELSGHGGERFESFMCRLIEAEAATHGITPADIDWDYRTNCPDGGGDIYIRNGRGKAKPWFIPAVPSIWSLKSGNDGTDAATVRSELTDNAHDRLRKHLKDGDVYVWCSLKPVSQPKRKRIYDEVEALAKDIAFDLAQVQFRWVDALASTLEAHPNLIVRHLPRLASRLKDVVTLDQRMRESPDRWGFDVNWVNFSGRDEVKRRVRDHLLSDEGSAVLHIAGISGIGKTRTAIQACRDEERLTDTLFVPRLAGLTRDFLRHIEEPGRYIRLVIDEVSLADYQRLSDRFRDCGDRIRVVTLGPARRRERIRESEPLLLILEEPDTTDGVLRVVQEDGAGLDPEVQKSLAELSGHDLRLALLLVHATRRNPELRHLPVRSLEDVWKRIMDLFKDALQDVGGFPKLYEMLTTSIDVGHDGKYRAEVDYLAAHFKVTAHDLARAIDAAHGTGLGTKTQQFFEAGPRALALWIFQDRLWPALRRDLDAFLTNMPTERLRRRFLERCHELEGPKREEVLDRVGGFFLGFLGDAQLPQLVDREKSRVFKAWAELDPERGLRWLLGAVQNASDDDVRALDGSPDGSGGWGGRRQIVWLCEHLACFKEHFWDCERVLFRLAQVETEESISNNSRNTWKAMFLPMFSNTEAPFAERLQHLLHRLTNATERTLDMVLSAAMDILGYDRSRMCPPTVVGGRVVPDEWRPRTRRELFECEAEAGRELLAEIARLRPELRRRGIRSVIEHVSEFVHFDLLAELQELMRGIDEDQELLRALRSAIDQAISLAEPEDDSAKEPAFLPALRQWRQELSPGDLREQIIDLTSRDYWSVYRNSRRQAVDEPVAAYKEMAQAILDDLPLLEGLGEWLNSEQCRSGGPLGFELGRADEQSRAMPLILGWLKSMRAASFASGYIQAAAFRIGALPAEAVPILEDLAERHPALAVSLSIEADRSPRGFERIMQGVGRLDAGQRGILRPMAFNEWPKIFTEEQKDRLLAKLAELADSIDPDALAVAFDLLAGWTEHGKIPVPKQLATRALHMLELAARPTIRVDDHDWKVVAELLIPGFPAELADVLADAITDVSSHRFQRGRYAEQAFTNRASRNPSEAMEAIGRWILDDERGPVFCICEFRGLFDAIGLETVRPWVQRHGAVAAVRIARNLNGPSLDDKGNPIVPELANWVLTEFETEDRVLREFCIGRHSGDVRWGHARDHQAEIEKLVKPFRDVPRPWVQQWAKYELDDLELEIRRDDQREDELERT